jgi:CRP-like cAMP-binding protein
MRGPSLPTANQLLRALPTADCARLFPQLEAVDLPADATLFEAAAPMEFAYFPTDSIVTLSYAVEKGSMARAWSVGREGMIGISLFLDSANRDNRADVELGGLAFRLPASVLQAEFRRAGALQRLLLRYVFALVTQSSQLSVCHRHHTVEPRFCNFLSRTFDQVNGNNAFITHVKIGMLLGVRRESVTEIALRLQGAGIIKYRRGQITLIDRKLLEARACACGRIIRRAFAAVSE